MKKTTVRCVLAGCSLISGLAVFAYAQNHAAKTDGPLLLVANQHDHNLSLVDPGAGKQVATVPVDGVTGHEVAASPDGKTAYVPIYGDSGVGRPGTDGTKMSVIDLASRKVVHTVDFGHGVRPHCAIYDRNSGMLYVTTELDKTVSIIDPKTLKIVGTVPTGQEQSHMLALSRDGSTRVHGERGAGNGVGAGYEGAEDAGDHSDLEEHAADRDLAGRQHGVYRGPDEAAACGDRYGDEQGEDVGAASWCRLWDGSDSWTGVGCWSRCGRRSRWP